MSSQTIRRANKDSQNPFKAIRRATFEDNRLSFEARGVLAYILVKPDDWQMQVADLMRQGDMGRDKAYRIINELIETGYCERVEERERGRIVGYSYLIHEEPLPEKPYTAQPLTAQPLTENKDYTNKENTTKEEHYTKEEKGSAASPPPATPSLAKKFSELLEELKTTKNRPACLREISVLCFGENSDTPTYAYLAKVAKQVGGAGRLAEEMWKLTTKPPTGDMLAYILGKCKSQKNGNGFGLTNWRKNNGEDSASEDIGGDSSEQADFWRNHFANNPVVPALPTVQRRGLGVCG